MHCICTVYSHESVAHIHSIAVLLYTVLCIGMYNVVYMYISVSIFGIRSGVGGKLEGVSTCVSDTCTVHVHVHVQVHADLQH